MGMAAGQARLLSITSRLSDNELRAQIINNNKMRLASESSQVSENYVNALNEAQYMVANYDANNNASFQQLTFNSLTGFNPYNNQYALINSAGQILVSETDYKNYQKHYDDIEGFLGEYGLKRGTSYFNDDIMPFAKVGDKIINANGEEEIVTENSPLKGKVLYTYFGSDGVLTNQSTGLTPEQLKAIYFGTQDQDMLNNISGALRGTPNLSELKGYEATEESKAMNDYNAALTTYQFKKEVYESYIKQGMSDKLDDIIKNESFNAFENLNSLKSSVKNATDVTTLSGHMLKIYNILNDGAGVIQYAKKERDGSNNALVTSLIAKIKANMYTEHTEFDKFYINNVNGDIFEGFDGNNNPTDIIDDLKYVAGNLQIKNEETGVWSNVTKGTDPSNAKTYNKYYTEYTEEIDGQTVTYTSVYERDDTQTPPILTITTTSPNSLENMKEVALDVLNTLSDNLIYIWDVSKLPELNKTSSMKDAYKEYMEAAIELANCIYGVNTDSDGNKISKYASQNASGDYEVNSGYPSIEDLDDISELYNGIGPDGKNYPKFQDSFYPIYLNIVLDNVMNTYGEPKVTWLTPETPNENSAAKYNWYVNLFNHIKETGCAIVKDGLASSPEWMRFAFESGIVTMEQLDKNEIWNPINYTNCSDITQQTNDAAIAKAEAEYNVAMNKIENKDKRYDLELKNIDTEHNSLQVEYESIKAAIDKNIERNFKLFG